MSELPNKILGRTGLKVTQLGYGAMELRGARSEVDDNVAQRILNMVLDEGINFIDTAPDYGVSEERIGKYVSHRRHEFYLATKCGCNIGPDGVRREPAHIWTADRLRKNIEQSLRRLKTDHVDILQMHNPSVQEVEQNGLIDVLQELRDEGKTRFIGVSSTTPHLAVFAHMRVFDTFQVPYSLLERTHEFVLEEAANLGAGIVVRGGIAKGHSENGERWRKWDQAKLGELSGGMDRYEFVLRFTLSHPACHTTIVGSGDPDHIHANLRAAARGPLPTDLYQRIKERMSPIGEDTQ